MSTRHRAEKLYRSFRERNPTRVRKLTVPPLPRAVAVLGHLSAVEYDTSHGTGSGSARGYRHVFAAGSRPLLASDGKRLFILRGRFRVTGRGIVDLSATGRERE